MKNKEYKVKIYTEHEKYVYLSVTHNGYQWASIEIEDQEEIPLIISALERHLIAHAVDAEKVEPCMWCGHPEGYWAERQTVYCKHH